MNVWAQKQKGFTIVELLIVIVVIAILAAITIVAYNGIQNSAKASAAQSALSQATKKIQMYAVENAESYPDTLAGAGVVDTDATSYQYTVNNASSPPSYCVTATFQDVSYFQSNTVTTPTAGACAGHGVNGLPPNLAQNGSFEDAAGLVTVRTNLVTNPTFEAGVSGWGAVNGGSGFAIEQSATQVHSGAQSLRFTYGTGAHADSGPGSTVSATSGATYTGSAWVYAPSAISSGVRMLAYGPALGGTLRGSTTTTVGGWVRVSLTVTANTTGPLSFVIAKSASTDETGKVLYVDSVLVEELSTTQDYFSGASVASGDYQYTWSGAAHASTSLQRANIPAEFHQNGSENVRFRSGVRSTAGNYAARVYTPNESVNPGLYQRIYLTPGTYTFIAKVWGESGLDGDIALTAQGAGVSALSAVSGYGFATSNLDQWIEIRRAITISSSDNVNLFVYVPGVSTSPGKSFWVDEYAVVEGMCTAAVCY